MPLLLLPWDRCWCEGPSAAAPFSLGSPSFALLQLWENATNWCIVATFQTFTDALLMSFLAATLRKVRNGATAKDTPYEQVYDLCVNEHVWSIKIKCVWIMYRWECMNYAAIKRKWTRMSNRNRAWMKYRRCHVWVYMRKWACMYKLFVIENIKYALRKMHKLERINYSQANM